MIARALLAWLISAAFFAGTAFAQSQGATPADILKTLHFQRGHVEIAGGIATIDLGPRYVYLDPQDGRAFLTKVWSNPDDSVGQIEGIILPTDVSPMARDGWAVVLEYENSGHVKDGDAASLNYDDLLEKMKKATNEANDERIKNGYPPILLVGWATTPHYDAKAKIIYWAKRLRFGNETKDTINYFIRALGRTGVLDLNVVMSADQLPLINSRVADLTSMVSFKPGSRYADYQEGSDHTAAYGLAGLIAGGVLVKAGFFKGLLVLLGAFWKVIAAAVVAVFAGFLGRIKQLFRRSPPA